jgi:hypothetical protein
MTAERAHGNFPPLNIARWREGAFCRRGRRLTTKQMRGSGQVLRQGGGLLVFLEICGQPTDSYTLAIVGLTGIHLQQS